MCLVYKNDIELIKALKNGEPRAYDFLVDSYHHKLCVYAYGLTNDHNLSEDIVQNIFVYLWKNRLKLKDSFSVKNYLYRSVYNEFIDHYRKKKAVIALEKKYIDALHYIVEEEVVHITEKS
jgi:RNA polymerase sigma-70 factor (ECF subfamily)